MSVYHKILGVGPNATTETIKKAYRRKAMRYHPDVNKAPNAVQKFHEIKRAYDYLIGGGAYGTYARSYTQTTTQRADTKPKHDMNTVEGRRAAARERLRQMDMEYASELKEMYDDGVLETMLKAKIERHLAYYYLACFIVPGFTIFCALVGLWKVFTVLFVLYFGGGFMLAGQSYWSLKKEKKEQRRVRFLLRRYHRIKIKIYHNTELKKKKSSKAAA